LNKGLAIYPGSFDPPTNGHLDLIERGSKIFEELVVAILRNSEKSPMFSVAERLEMLRTLTGHLKNVRIDTFDGLMVEYAKSMDAICILRGIRAISDYEYELQMALMNRKLEPTLETVFMMPADKYSYVSSRCTKFRQECMAEKKRKGRREHDDCDQRSAETHRPHQPHRTFRHDGSSGRGRQAARAGH
jgi:pantetheine-phosphate adenylyltransferase